MSARQILEIAVKLVGFYFFVSLAIYSVVPAILMSFDSDNNSDTRFFVQMASTLFWIAVGMILSYMLVLKSNSIVSRMAVKGSLDQARMEGISDEALLKIGFILIAGFTVVENIPETVTEIIALIKDQNSTSEDVPSYRQMQSKIKLWRSGIALLIGILMLTNYDRLAKWTLPKKES